VDDPFDTRSDTGLKKAICKSVERTGTSFGTGEREAAEIIFYRTGIFGDPSHSVASPTWNCGESFENWLWMQSE